MPKERVLEGGRSAKTAGVGQVTADDLQPDREAVRGTFGRHGSGGLSGEVERERESPSGGRRKQAPVDDLRSLVVQGERRDGKSRRDQQDVILHEPPHLVVDGLADRLGGGQLLGAPFRERMSTTFGDISPP